MQKTTSEKLDERWQAMILQLRHVISNWEHHWKGDGGLMNELDAEE